MGKLEEFRQKRGLTYLGLASLLSNRTGRPFSKGTVHGFCSGNRRASFETIYLIWQATDGFVEPNDWFDLDPSLLQQQQVAA